MNNFGTSGPIGASGRSGVSGTFGTSGPSGLSGWSSGPTGTSGLSGTSGPSGYLVDWEEEISKKYKGRFTISTEYDSMTFAPINHIIDNNTGKKWTFKPNNISDVLSETDKFIQRLIIELRDEKINDIINE